MPKTSKDAPADYAVGRGRPPAHTRFQPGQSGNPGGRKRGSLNLRTVLTAVLESEVTLTENGRRRTVSMLETLVLRQIEEGLKGQARAIESLLDRYERHASQSAAPDEDLPEEDRALIDRALGGAGPQAAEPDEAGDRDREDGHE